MVDKSLLDKLAKAIIDGDEEAARQVAHEILVAGIGLEEVASCGVRKGLDILGEKYQRLEVFLADLILAGDAVKACMEVLVPPGSSEQVGKISLGTVVIGTVSGDVHDIGKNIVALMLQTEGFEVYDLGVDVPVKRFIEKAAEVKAKIIALSALLSMTALYQEEVIKYLKGAGLREKYFVVVGGAPISSQWATRIGADGYARTAVGAKQLCKRLVTEKMLPPLSQPLVVEQ